MNPYIVRLDGSQKHPHELVGIFVAKDVEQLERLVDECCDTDGCEYMVLPEGGLYWGDHVGFTVPYRGVDEDAPPKPAGASSTDSWDHAFYDENDGEWLPLRMEE